MSDELIDIFDSKGKRTGKTCLKSVAHLKGYWHACIDVWLYTKGDKVLIQKRVKTKDTFPNLWDVSVAGHVGSGENLLQAAQRELSEELGINLGISDLKYIGSLSTDIKHNENLVDREHHYIYIAEFKVPIESLVLQIDEVSEVKLISMSNLKKMLFKEEKHTFVPYSLDYFNLVSSAIQ